MNTPFAKVQIINAHAAPTIPQGLESLAAMRCIPLTDGTRLSFTPLKTDGVLVLASAMDKRTPCRLMLRDAVRQTEERLDVGFCSIAQRFHLPLPAGTESLRITALDEDATFWVLDDERVQPDSVPAIWPVSKEVDRLERFYRRLENDCLAEFGWMGGCVLEAFDALAKADNTPRWRSAGDRWLSHFLTDEHLQYQNAYSRPMRDTFDIIEATLPIASIVRRWPNHPIVDITIDYLKTQARRDATCEGCYTVAYPLMQMAVTRQRSDLAELALTELQLRREKLFHDNAIYLRHHGTHRTYRNWTRGIAWYLLGHAECLALAGMNGPWAKMAEHLAERAEWILRYQRPDGLWDNFLDERDLPADTSGSAGIATALVVAHELGLIDKKARLASERCWAGMQKHLFIDGWLGSVAASNKQGEAVQHGHQRASETFGMGLMGRLAAVRQTHRPS